MSYFCSKRQSGDKNSESGGSNSGSGGSNSASGGVGTGSGGVKSASGDSNSRSGGVNSASGGVRGVFWCRPMVFLHGPVGCEDRPSRAHRAYRADVRLPRNCTKFPRTQTHLPKPTKNSPRQLPHRPPLPRQQKTTRHRQWCVWLKCLRSFHFWKGCYNLFKVSRRALANFVLSCSLPSFFCKPV